MLLGFDRQGWITAFAAVLLALITLLTSYSHVDFLGAASVDLPQQAGIPCIAAAEATAIEQQVGIQRSTSTWSATRSSNGCSRRPAEPITTRERGRAARRAQQQAQCNLVQLRHQLDPSDFNARRVRDLISCWRSTAAWSDLLWRRPQNCKHRSPIQHLGGPRRQGVLMNLRPAPLDRYHGVKGSSADELSSTRT